MLAIITGVSGSGKSECAENRAMQLSGGENLYYVATKVYIKPLGIINQKLVEVADEAVEIVYSVPMTIK